MPYPTLMAGGFSLLMFAAGDAAAIDQPVSSALDQVTPVVDVADLRRVDPKSNPFPTQAMAQQFADYLAWTKAQGLSRLVVFEALSDDQAIGAARLPSEEMTKQFEAYLRWTELHGLSRYYAFNVTNFD
jgi:hypothetical protein